MIEGVQTGSVVALVVGTVGLVLDMGMNGARYASGAWVVLMGMAGAVWFIAEWVR